LTGILFDFGFVEESRQTVLGTIGSLASHIEDIDALVRRISETWTGDAAEAFKVKHAEWRQAAVNIHEDLQYLHTVVCTSQDNFAGAHTTVQGLWGAGA
jgi:WXG100 family type VII secretion target